MRYNRRVLVSDVASHSQDPTICAAPELHKQGLDVTRLEARSETFILTGEALGNSSLMNFDSIFDHMHLILLTSSDRSPSVPRTIEVDGPFSTAENSLDVTLVMTPEEIIPSKRFFRQNDPVWNALLSPAGLCCKKNNIVCTALYSPGSSSMEDKTVASSTDTTRCSRKPANKSTSQQTHFGFHCEHVRRVGTDMLSAAPSRTLASQARLYFCSRTPRRFGQIAESF